MRFELHECGRFHPPNTQWKFKLRCEGGNKFGFFTSENQFIKNVQVQTYNSYYLKHLVEKWSGKYISNGAFITAVRFMKIPFRPICGTLDISITIFLKEDAASF